METLYLRVKPETKAWLKALCAKQLVKTSQSTMVEHIFGTVKSLNLQVKVVPKNTVMQRKTIK